MLKHLHITALELCSQADRSSAKNNVFSTSETL